MGRSREIDIENKTKENQKYVSGRDSFSSQSPLEDIPLLLPQEADKPVAPNVDHKLNGLNTTEEQKAEALAPNRQMIGFADDFDAVDFHHEMNSNSVPEFGFKTSEECWETSEEGDHDIYISECGQVGPRLACRSQVSYCFGIFIKIS